jgi:hypothetical protein
MTNDVLVSCQIGGSLAHCQLESDPSIIAEPQTVTRLGKP